MSAAGLCCRRARFLAGVQFRVRWSRVVLDEADFPAPSLLSGIPRLSSERLAAREQQIVGPWQRLFGSKISEQPQLFSLRRANVAGLGLSNVIMTDCHFAGAHNLDILRLEANVALTNAPSPLPWLSWPGRQVIAEERALRADRHYRGWLAPSWPSWLGESPDVLDASQIADLYRALRKGREDIKNEPGAADLYYGEMEMRRLSSRGGEHWLLTAYRLVSGYSLRATRALASLILLLVVATCIFATVGFAPTQITQYKARGNASPTQAVIYKPEVVNTKHLPGWSAAIIYSADGATSLLRPTQLQQPLTVSGETTEIMLRLLGPLLVGLAVLACKYSVIPWDGMVKARPC